MHSLASCGTGQSSRLRLRLRLRLDGIGLGLDRMDRMDKIIDGSSSSFAGADAGADAAADADRLAGTGLLYSGR